MQVRKAIALLSVVLFFAIPIHNVIAASTMTESFRGNGITVDIEFPDEAHPAETITYNVTITANTNLILQKFNITIWLQTNSTTLHIRNQTTTEWNLLENENLISHLGFTLPPNANGKLYCLLYVQTDQSADYSSYSFYTTYVSNLTFTEMQNLHNEMLANYNSLEAKYNAQFLNYQSLLSSNSNLENEYNTANKNLESKSNQYKTLQSDYQTMNSTMNDLKTTYNALNQTCNALNQTNTNLQERLVSLQEKVNPLQTAVDTYRVAMFIFVATVAGLIAFIIYIKQRSKDPYIVIRKETVSAKIDE